MMGHTPRRYWLLALILQLSIVFLLPVLPDEAYFVSWGEHWSLGYYDHPPMTGWVAALFHALPKPDLFLRLAMVALGLGLCVLLHSVLRSMRDAQDAGILTLVWLLLPINLLVFSLFLNDTLAYFFGAVFVIALQRSWSGFHARRGGVAQALLAGLALGLALMTKYIVAMYLIAALLVFLLHLRGNFAFLLQRLSLVALVSSLCFGVHLWWNWNHCLVNLGFNFVSRESLPAHIGGLQWLLSLGFILGPLLVMTMLRPALRRGWHEQGAFYRPLFWASALVMLGVALSRGQFGTHWAGMISLIAVLAWAESAQPVSAASIRKQLWFGAAVVGLLLGVVVALHADWRFLPEKRWEKLSGQLAFQDDAHSGALAKAIERTAPGAIVATESYGLAAALDNDGIDTKVLFSLSKFGRNDDLFEDASLFDGRDVLLFDVGFKNEPERIGPYFESLSEVQVRVAGRSYPALLGRGLRYADYRRDFVLPAIERFYEPMRPYARACPMDRYR